MCSAGGSAGDGGGGGDDSKQDEKGNTGGGEESEDSVMDYKPGRVLKVDELNSVKGAVTTKLGELMDEPCDEVFPEYITVMVSNGKTIRCVSGMI